MKKHGERQMVGLSISIVEDGLSLTFKKTSMPTISIDAIKAALLKIPSFNLVTFKSFFKKTNDYRTQLNRFCNEFNTAKNQEGAFSLLEKYLTIITYSEANKNEEIITLKADFLSSFKVDGLSKDAFFKAAKVMIDANILTMVTLDTLFQNIEQAHNISFVLTYYQKNESLDRDCFNKVIDWLSKGYISIMANAMPALIKAGLDNESNLSKITSFQLSLTIGRMGDLNQQKLDKACQSALAAGHKVTSSLDLALLETNARQHNHNPALFTSHQEQRRSSDSSSSRDAGAQLLKL